MSAKAVSFGILIVSVCIAAVGQILFKFAVSGDKFERFTDLSAQITNVPLVVGFGAYFCSALLYVYALQTTPLSIAYPSLAFGYVLVLASASLIFGETLTLFQLCGVMLICSGLTLLWV